MCIYVCMYTNTTLTLTHSCVCVCVCVCVCWLMLPHQYNTIEARDLSFPFFFTGESTGDLTHLPPAMLAGRVRRSCRTSSVMLSWHTATNPESHEHMSNHFEYSAHTHYHVKLQTTRDTSCHCCNRGYALQQRLRAATEAMRCNRGYALQQRLRALCASWLRRLGGPLKRCLHSSHHGTVPVINP